MAEAPSSNYIVLCNLPHGLVCQVGDKRVTLRGSACYLQPNPKRKFQNPKPEDQILAATINFVDKKFWDEFVKDKTDKTKYPQGFGPFESKQILWSTDRGSVAAMRRESEGAKSGFEQLNPDAMGIQKENSHPSGSTVMMRD